MSDWLRCLDCGWLWDDENEQHEVCAFFDANGVRRSEEVSCFPVYGIDGQINGATNVPPYLAIKAAISA